MSRADPLPGLARTLTTGTGFAHITMAVPVGDLQLDYGDDEPNAKSHPNANTNTNTDADADAKSHLNANTHSNSEHLPRRQLRAILILGRFAIPGPQATLRELRTAMALTLSPDSRASSLLLMASPGYRAIPAPPFRSRVLRSGTIFS